MKNYWYYNYKDYNFYNEGVGLILGKFHANILYFSNLRTSEERFSFYEEAFSIIQY